ncbi:diguanylate cyclase [Gammaproteobacteria bacterium]
MRSRQRNGKRPAKNQAKPSPFPSLRDAAEAALADTPPVETPSLSIGELLHELRVHQIELEMQNEALRQTQIELEVSRDTYVDLYEFAPVGYLTLSREGVILQMNLTGATLLGEDRQKLISRRFDALIMPEDRIRWAQQFMRTVQCDDKLSCELTLRHGEGIHRQVRLECLRMTTKDKPPVVRVAVIDITERRQAEAALRESETKYRLLSESADDFIFWIGPEGHYLYVSPACERISGYSAMDFQANPDLMASIVHPDDRTAFRQHLATSAHADLCELEFRILNRDGSVRWISHYCKPMVGEQGEHLGRRGSNHDITERKRAEDSLRLAASVFSNAQEGIVITDPGNRIIDVNQAFTRITGYEHEEVLGKNPNLLRSDRQDEAFYARMWQSIQMTGTWQGEIWNRNKSGVPYPEMLAISAVPDDTGEVQHYVGVFSDISLIKAHEAELESIAYYDPLTGVPNRRLLVDRLSQSMAHAQRSGRLLAICYFDLDGFKPVNDHLGHDAGDQLLVEITCRLQNLLRAGDTLARVGGDEFALLLGNLEQDTKCFDILERVLASIKMPVSIKNQSVSVSASIGVTLFPGDNVDAGNLLHHADEAMYQAKKAGKNRFNFFNSE